VRHQFLVNAGTVYDAGDAKDRVFAVPVDSNIRLLCTREGEMDGIFGGGIKDIGARLEVDISGARLLETESFGSGVKVNSKAVTELA